MSIAHHQPTRVLANDELAAMVDTSDEWIRSRVGITTRHIAAEDESVADMAVGAAAKAVARAGVDAADIDLVLVATCTAVDRMPSTAARVAHQLGVPTAAVFDLNAACAGFTYALATADLAIRGGGSQTALVIGADKMSDFLDWTDRTSCVIFGDGAGAAVVTAADASRGDLIGPVVWGSQPERGSAITLGTTGPAGPPALFRQDGHVVYRWAMTSLAPVARRACERAGVAPADLAAVVTHQANLRIIEAVTRQIGATGAVVARDVVDSGNTSAASVPLALSKLVERAEVPSGAPVLLLGFGAGLSYAAQVVGCP
ncbi:ketoacyl-ACP synthase III [Streptomyces alfalfae]|uniref:Beta-ketoacyl-[acyl-carrier-protein] synthase III n=1 Tax=Streptomyces alfalfae TaxID=1642299 RepID=A0A4Q2GLH5_9ACTN|nr:ketoacyl-ACP synthase III [Streptomyces fradiae]QQC93510.1 ketoacyl-ACP synthase III [Streptomyces alfalfae]THC44806.1 ketoacyl-ACP synthase III [Streptomyces sp. A1499]QQC94242.1 ketoacyl-ACP synthase III [Streptomyces alfalfae]QUI35588.1 ketoacyl-ACP synthase III [Streptomyces alfalfae]